ncbi:MAG: HEPN domain-containing protein [Spirochaetia bacterium]|nr:HEPN domain-containing protein [Spirochaetia bacterium]
MIDDLYRERSEYFEKWDKAYSRTLDEVNQIVDNLDYLKRNEHPVFQDLSIKFFSIHLANFFYFHIRKKIVDKNLSTQIEKLLLTGFNNESFLPSVKLMDQYLSYLEVEEKDFLYFHEEYKTLNTLRNKYAHGATAETNVQITFDQFKEYFEKIKSL